MAYQIAQQLDNDLNWFFIDRWNRICHAASAGGILPDIISENSENNDKFNEIVFDLPERYKPIRNENVENILRELGVQDFERYFKDFETMARKGLYSFDKFDVADSEDARYFLVAYPSYDPANDPYPISRDLLKMVTRTKVAIKRTTKNPINLKYYFDQHLIYL